MIDLTFAHVYIVICLAAGSAIGVGLKLRKINPLLAFVFGIAITWIPIRPVPVNNLWSVAIVEALYAAAAAFFLGIVYGQVVPRLPSPMWRLTTIAIAMAVISFALTLLLFTRMPA